MIVLGLILLIVGYLLGVGVLQTLGVLLVVIGVCLFALGAGGLPVGGRRNWW